MKQKLLDALKQGHKNLGLSDEAFERVATFGETFITEDGQIETFVKGASGLLKAEQSAADKVRSELNGKIKALEGEKADLEAKLNGGNGGDPEPAKKDEPNIAEIVKAAVAEAVKPYADDLAIMKAEKAKENAMAALDNLCRDWDYAKNFPEESENAYRVAMKIYKATGEKMTGDELIKTYREEFDPAVKKKGVSDFSQPFKSGGTGDGDPNFSAFERVTATNDEN